jgi:hypothetical protein
MIFAKRLAGQGHRRELTIERNATSGWIAREHDDTAIRTSLFHDWRRVEMAIALFELKALALQNQGWAEIPQES